MAARLVAAQKILGQQIAGLGPIRPRAPNDTPLGRTSNRRVEVRVVSLASQQMVYADRGDVPEKPGRR